MPEPHPAPPEPPPRPPGLSPRAQRLRFWAELLHRLLAAIAAAVAIWRGLG